MKIILSCIADMSVLKMEIVMIIFAHAIKIFLVTIANIILNNININKNEIMIYDFYTNDTH